MKRILLFLLLTVFSVTLVAQTETIRKNQNFIGSVNFAGLFKIGGVTITATGTEINFNDGVISAIQTQFGSITSDLADYVTFPTPGTTGNVLTSNGSDWVSASATGTASVDSIRVLSSEPTTGNVYISSADRKIHYLTGGYWHRLAILDSTVSANAQNKVLYSEKLDEYPSWEVDQTVLENQANDLEGNATLDRLTQGSAFTSAFANVNVVGSTNYVFSFDAKRGTLAEAYYKVRDVTHSADIIAPTGYYSLINGSTTTRVSFPFTTPAGCTHIHVVIILADGTGTIFIGRVQVAEVGKIYIKTTDTAF
jgi:hypothetical protein